MKTTVAIAVTLLALAVASEAARFKQMPVQKASAASLAISTGEGDLTRLNGTGSGPWSDGGTQFDTRTNDRKSVFTAGLLSALVPGGGEYYLGYRKKARCFFAGEVLTWVGFISFHTYSNWKEDDYIRYAAAYANARLEDKDDDFRDLVGFYDDIDQYNAFGRISIPDRQYLEDTPENHWRWQSEQDRNTYRELKNRSRDASRRADFMIGIAIVSRVVSVIDAVRDAKRSQRRLDDPFSQFQSRKFKLAVNPFRSRNQISLTFITDF